MFKANSVKTDLAKLTNNIINLFELKSLITFSRFYKRHLDRLRNQNRFFNVKGVTVQSTFSLELQKVFVELKITLPKIYKTRTDDFSAEEQWNIWQLFESNKPNNRILAIIGKPGSGKTTLLQNIALMMALQKAPGKSKRLIPFHLPLRRCTQEIVYEVDKPAVLAQLLEKDLQEIKPSSEWFARVLTRFGQHCVILLDGLDEVADRTEREKVARWVEEQTTLYSHVRFIITSRPHGYRNNPIEGATVLELEDFSYDQIVEFVGQWYRATEIAANGKSDAGILKLAKDNADDLVRRIFKSEVLSKLAISPLLLTMITMVHRFVGTLPEMRAALYEDIFRVLLGRRQEILIKGTKLNIFKMRAILQELALAMMKKQQRELSTQETIRIIGPSLQKIGLKSDDNQLFIDKIINDSGLLVEPDQGQIAFTHLTYQEYMSAVEINNLKMENYLIEKIGESWWHETILLYGAISDATEIVRTCLDNPDRSVERLKLAYELFQEAMFITPEERKRLEKEVVLEAESDDKERQSLAADLLFELRLKKMIRVENDLEIDPFFISLLEYQSFINDTGRKPDHWTGLRFETGKALMPVEGIRRHDAEEYTIWLTRRAQKLGYRTSTFRLPNKDEAKRVIIKEEVDDPNFKNLANKSTSAWLSDSDQVYFISEKHSYNKFRQKFIEPGEMEIKRIGNYYKSLYEMIGELSNKINLLSREIESPLYQLNQRRIEDALSALPEKVGEYLGIINVLKDDYKYFEKQFSLRNFLITIDSERVNKLDVELIDLKRLRFITVRDEEYQAADKDKIIELLSNTKRKIDWLGSMLITPSQNAKSHQSELFKMLDQILREFSGYPIDLDEQLSFLDELKDVNLSKDEIKLVKERAISRNFEKARAELLALAEYFVFQNQIEMSKKIIRAYWAIFFIEQRSKKEKPLPAWEGLRLVREIRLIEEKSAT